MQTTFIRAGEPPQSPFGKENAASQRAAASPLPFVRPGSGGKRPFARLGQLLPLCVLAINFLPHSNLQAKEGIDYIDPFIGTGHQGKDFPGASLPFSMVKINPLTNTGLGYTFGDKTVYGFGIDQLGGADGGELGNFLVMATTGPLKVYQGDRGKPGSGFLSAFSKDTEKASPGYYAVTLDDYKIRAEATVAMHSGMLRFTFPATEQARIQVDLSHRNAGTSLHQTVKVVDDHTIEGMMEYTGAGGGWTFGGSTRYTAYYHAEFSKPFTKYGVTSATLPPEWNATPPVPWGGKPGIAPAARGSSRRARTPK